jgi:hypothetical protein
MKHYSRYLFCTKKSMPDIETVWRKARPQVACFGRHNLHFRIQDVHPKQKVDKEFGFRDSQ